MVRVKGIVMIWEWKRKIEAQLLIGVIAPILSDISETSINSLIQFLFDKLHQMISMTSSSCSTLSNIWLQFWIKPKLESLLIISIWEFF